MLLHLFLHLLDQILRFNMVSNVVEVNGNSTHFIEFNVLYSYLDILLSFETALCILFLLRSLSSVKTDLINASLLRWLVNLSNDDFFQTKSSLITTDKVLKFLRLSFNGHFSRSQKFRIHNARFIIIRHCDIIFLLACQFLVLLALKAL